MSLALFVIAALALFYPTVLAVTPAQVEAGRIEGFTAGKTSTHVGDYLLSTFCFCADPTAEPPKSSEANYLQFEYYNAHRNTTFILSHLCIAGRDSPTTCLAPRSADGLAVSTTFVVKGKLCRTWNVDIRPSLEVAKDTLCYEASADNAAWRQNRIPRSDVLRFNNQKRNLGAQGGQAPWLRKMEEAEDKCAVLCREHTGMDALRGDDRAQCHIISYESMDDMCPHCK